MLFKRNETWYYKFTISGKTIYRSTSTKDKEKAKEIADKAKAQAWNVIKGGKREVYTWQEAVVRYLQEAEKKSIDDDKYMFRWLEKHLYNVHLHEIDKRLIEKIIAAKLKEGASKSRVNRVTTLLNTLLTKAMKEWEWITNKPHIRKFKEPKVRIRWITQEQAIKLISELPEHLSYIAQFTLATGLRESNVLSLEWQQIDMQRGVAWIHPDQSKAEKAIGVPLNDEAICVLRNLIGKHHTHVFTYKENPIGKAGTAAWRKALKRASIDNFRWHDLRHTWASWHVQNGTPLHILKELGGWSSYDMVQRYAHLAPEHLAEFTKNSTFKIVAKPVAVKNEIKLKIV